jgi:hypothetical protein
VRSNVAATVAGNTLRTLSLNGGPARATLGGLAAARGAGAAGSGYELIGVPLEPDLRIRSCTLSDPFPGAGARVSARVEVENVGLACSPIDAQSRSAVGLRAIFLAEDGSNRVAATAPLPCLAPGSGHRLELELEMPHDPVRVRVELFPNPIDRDPTNNSRECFFGAPAPEDLACAPLSLANGAQTPAIRLSWSNPALYDEIILCRDGATAAFLPGDSRSYVDAEAAPGARVYTLRGRIGASKSARAAASCVLAPPPRFARGDANGDGALGVADAVAILLHLFRGAPVPGCLKAADVNDSSDLDIADPLALLFFLFAGGAAPAAPHPGCGTDPTPDPLACVEPPACR